MRRLRGKATSARWLDELSRFELTKASQLREKSEQWFADTEFLFQRQRLAAAVYLGGFVIECLLKSLLWSRRVEAPVASLIGRSHNLGELLAASGPLVAEARLPGNRPIWQAFEFLQGWSVRVRYNPKRPSLGEVAEYRKRLIEVRRWLLGRI